MSSYLVSFDKAEVSSDLKVCCEKLANDIKEDKIKVKVRRFKSKTTINGGPGYKEKYLVDIISGETDISQCPHCGKQLTDSNVFLNITYTEKKES